MLTGEEQYLFGIRVAGFDRTNGSLRVAAGEETFSIHAEYYEELELHSAREIAPGQRFYVNTTESPVAIPLERPGTGVLTEREYGTELVEHLFLVSCQFGQRAPGSVKHFSDYATGWGICTDFFYA